LQTAVDPRRSSTADRLANPAAVLTRSDLRELGWERRAVDAIVRGCPAVAIPGYSRTVILVSDYLELIEASTYRGDRVRPT
jgi:hypothetical protein